MTKQPRLSPEDKESLKGMILPLVNDIHRVALSLCHNPSKAEELAAETIFRACANFHRLRDRTRVKQWLLRILSNTFISSLRADKRGREVELPSTDAHDGESPFSLFDRLSVPMPLFGVNPEQEVINKLLDEDIRRAIALLPEEFRVAVVLCDVEGYSYAEIAAMLRIPVGTVRSRIARGRSHLQRALWHHAREAGIIRTSSRKATHVQAETAG